MDTNLPQEKEAPFKEEGYLLMAAVFEVHSENGGGLAEEVYQESLQIELADRGIPFIAKQEIAIFYKGRELTKRYIPDLYVFGGIVVELKAVSQLLTEHTGQLMNYMRLTKKRVGYLVNFGPLKAVEWKRFII